MALRNKIKTLTALAAMVKELKRRNKKIVTTNGVFDILHLGHIYSFLNAKKYGDVLIIALNTDRSVKKIKGNLRPINNQNNRALLLASLAMVDYVFLFNEKTPEKVLAELKPNFHVKGSEYKGRCPEEKIINKFGGRVIYLKKIPRHSTTNLIKSILKAYR